MMNRHLHPPSYWMIAYDERASSSAFSNHKLTYLSVGLRQSTDEFLREFHPSNYDWYENN